MRILGITRLRNHHKLYSIIAAYLIKVSNYEWKDGFLHRGGQHDDVVGVAGIHIACKNHEWQRQDWSITGQVMKGQK